MLRLGKLREKVHPRHAQTKGPSIVVVRTRRAESAHGGPRPSEHGRRNQRVHGHASLLAHVVQHGVEHRVFREDTDSDRPPPAPTDPGDCAQCRQNRPAARRRPTRGIIPHRGARAGGLHGEGEEQRAAGLRGEGLGEHADEVEHALGEVLSVCEEERSSGVHRGLCAALGLGR